jgi:DNA polymerase III epsilon subunit-like protein
MHRATAGTSLHESHVCSKARNLVDRQNVNRLSSGRRGVMKEQNVPTCQDPAGVPTCEDIVPHLGRCGMAIHPAACPDGAIEAIAQNAAFTGQPQFALAAGVPKSSHAALPDRRIGRKAFRSDAVSAPPPSSAWAVKTEGAAAAAVLNGNSHRSLGCLAPTSNQPLARKPSQGNVRERQRSGRGPDANFTHARPRLRADDALAEDTLRVAGRPRWIAIDTETSGFSTTANQLVSLAAVEFVHGEATGKSLSVLVTPESESFDFHPMAQKKNGLTLEQLRKHGVPVAAALQRLTDFIMNSSAPTALVFHNQAFDLRFLRAAAAKVDLVQNLTRENTLGAYSDDRCATEAAWLRVLGLDTSSAVGLSGDGAVEEVLERATHSVELPVVCTMALFRAMYPEQPTNLDEALRFVSSEWRRRDETSAHDALEDATLTGCLFTMLSAVVADLCDSTLASA